MNILVVIVVILVILSIYNFIANRSPEGYEDESGFHLGEKK